jgi:hypothetical protein
MKEISGVSITEGDKSRDELPETDRNPINNMKN